MSWDQLKAYLKTVEAKASLVKNAQEAGFDVSDEDLEKVVGGDDSMVFRFKDGLDVKDGITLKR